MEKRISLYMDDKSKIVITDKKVNAGFCFSFKDMKSSDLKLLRYKIFEELVNRNEG